ncbi:52 kDa repressor of the inhibitor of the protein kinase [Oopsacas minuta]|uniref:52 kDa repressor of the inhibitor of the protein kinase n=1 Tax=Oopsacas minuta TaxID=111878 RepID=A0AAV7K4N0_9METZ|nr:52 kDa repressor of the inhibitor of the protein kinase [Oopsacas minuta]
MAMKPITRASKEYHRSAMTRMREFLARYEDPSQSVGTMLDTQAQRVMDNNQKEEEDEGSNEGNFVQLVRFRVETDKVLADYLAKGPKNARYTSKTIQNELVGVVGDKIRSDIIEEVKGAKFYSFIADEVTDASNKEELFLVIRYVHEGQIRKVFVNFVEVQRITGRVLGEAILKWLRDNNTSPADMRGQCYDGASNMAGARLGVSFSAKRQRLLDKAIEASNHTSKARKLKDSCRTRWVKRIDSYAVFLELLSPLHTCLQAMVDRNSHTELGTDWSWDGETITKANGFLFQL